MDLDDIEPFTSALVKAYSMVMMLRNSRASR